MKSEKNVADSLAKKRYSPIEYSTDDSGAISINQVSTAVQCAQFIGWLSGRSSGQKDERKKVYERLGSEEGQVAKIKLIEAVAGSFLKQHMRNLSRTAKDIDLEFLQEDPTSFELDNLDHESFEYRQVNLIEKAQKEKVLLESFLRAVGQEVFKKVYVNLGYEKADLDALCQTFSSKNDFIKQLVSTLHSNTTALAPKRSKVGKKSTIAQSFEDYSSTPQARAQLMSEKSCTKIGAEDSGAGVQKVYAELAPLIEYLNAVDVQERAEIMLRFEQYIQSGYAQMDIEGKIVDSATSAHHRDTMSWQSTLKAFKEEPQNVSSQMIIEALNARMSHIFYELKVKKMKVTSKEAGVRSSKDYNIEEISTFCEKEIGFTDLQGSGRPDGVCLSKDGKQLLVGFSSAANDLHRQGDQWQRHVSAIKNLMEYKRNYNDFKKVEKISCTVLYPSLISDPGLKGAQAGAKILDYFDDQNLIKGMQKHVQECLNILPFLNRLLASPDLIDFKDLNKFKVNIVGSTGALWNDSIQNVPKKATVQQLEEHNALVVAQCYEQIFDVLAQCKLKPFSISGIQNSTEVLEEFLKHVSRAPDYLNGFLEKHMSKNWETSTGSTYVKLIEKINSVLEQTMSEPEVKKDKMETVRRNLVLNLNERKSELQENIKIASKVSFSSKSESGNIVALSKETSRANGEGKKNHSSQQEALEVLIKNQAENVKKQVESKSIKKRSTL